MARRSYPHVTKAKKYARDVVNGKRVAGHFEIRACQRFLDDLQRKDLVFKADKAERACKFIELLPLTKGKWARERELLVLQPWQCFIVVNIFGWYLDKLTRRFNEAYVRVGRKNGKSPLAAAIGLYMFVEDGEYGAEVYSGATSEKQAWEVYRPAKQMAQKAAEFEAHYGVEIMAKNMNVPADDSRFEPMIGNPGDGASPSCAIIDEYHEHNTPAMYNTMVSGMGARDNPLLLIITTAGTDISAPCYEKDVDVQNILNGSVEDDSIFAIIFAADKEDAEKDNWLKLRAFKKANPNLDVSVSKRYLERQAQKARRSPSDQSTFKTKNLNIWVGAGSVFLNPLDWDQCGQKLDIADFYGWSCIFGVDLSSRIDITALIRLFYRRVDDGKGKGNLEYFCFPRFWIPENRLTDDDSGRYERWVEQGKLETHADDEIDFAELRKDIKAEAELCSPAEIAYDPWRAMGLEQELTNDGFTMVKIAQTVQSFTSPMEELQAAHLASRRIKHDNNPVMNWMVGNMVAKEDTNGNKKPRREIAKNKIDGPVALLMAINRAMAQPENKLGWLSEAAS